MSYSQKAKGWRQLVVEHRQFRWRFIPGYAHSTLKLQGSKSSGQQAIFSLLDWSDPWYLERVDPNEPSIITPRFATAAIGFALAHGWDPEIARQPLYLNYRARVFGLPESVRPSRESAEVCDRSSWLGKSA
jgi:hypothetical protein